jgi:tetratricopeptide (TPR) repeat protein
MILNGDCDGIIHALREAAFGHAPDIIPYLQDSYQRYRDHPCFSAIEREIGFILASLPDPDSIIRFCENGDIEPDPLLNQILDSISDAINDRDHQSAEELMRNLLPIGMAGWPESTTGREVRSFRDLVEYLYYMVVYEPDREVVIRSFTQTRIMYLHGLILLGKREFSKALEILRLAEIQSPVHAGILNAIADCELSVIRGDITRMIKGREIGSLEHAIDSSLRFSWLEDELLKAFINQGSLLALKGDTEGAIACYLMADTWDNRQDGRPELDLLVNTTGKEIDPGYYITHGTEILASRGIPAGPNPEMIALLIRMADDYLEGQDLKKAREYLFRAYQLTKRDDLQDRIWRIERFIEDMVDF